LLLKLLLQHWLQLHTSQTAQTPAAYLQCGVLGCTCLSTLIKDNRRKSETFLHLAAIKCELPKSLKPEAAAQLIRRASILHACPNVPVNQHS